jgi:RNA polymerase sigma-70 factor (ECF subfamily)
VHAFSTACQTGDDLALAAVLAPAVRALVDGGGRLRIDPSPAHGLEDVSGVLRPLLGRQPELGMTVRPVNGAAGLVVYRRAGAERPGNVRRAGAERPGNVRRAGAEVVAVVSLDVVDERVHQVCVVVNPDKLRSWNRH